MKVKFAVLADYGGIDAGGKLNIIGVFSRFNPPTLPHSHHLFFVVAQFEADHSEAGNTQNVSFSVIAPDGEPIVVMDMLPFELQPAPNPSDIIEFPFALAMQGLTFLKEGDYKVRISINEETAFSLDFILQKKQ